MALTCYVVHCPTRYPHGRIVTGGSSTTERDSYYLLMFAWKMTRPVNLFALYSGLPLVGLGSFAVQTSVGGCAVDDMAHPLLFWFPRSTHQQRVLAASATYEVLTEGPAMRITLISTEADQGYAEIVLDRLPAMIGRSEGVDVRLEDVSVSHYHCKIDNLGGVVVVRDLGSRFGTYVNGNDVTERILQSGDLLTLGKTQFRAHYEPSARRRTPRGSRRFKRPPGERSPKE